MGGRPLALGLIAAGIALGVASVRLGQSHPGWWFAGESTFAAALGLVAGIALVATGAGAWLRRPASRFGPLLALAGLAWFVPEWNNPEIGGSLAFTAALALSAVCPALVAHAALAYPGGRLRSSAERAAVAAAYLACAGLFGVLPALLLDPTAEGCGDCPENLLRLTSDVGLAEDLQRLGLWLGALSAALLLGLAAWRTARASVAERRLTAPVLAPAGIYLVAVALQFVHGAERGFLSNDSFELPLWVAQGGALSLLAAGVGWEWVRTRRTHSALTALVLELERSPAPGGLRDALARRLGDPSLELLHRLPDGGLIDAAGTRRTPGPGVRLTPLVSGGRTLAVVEHRTEAFDDPALARAVVSAAGLALDHQRLQAELRAQLEDLRASRARIVAAGDAERRRIERNLHDGAQQRLVALSLSIGLAIAQADHPDRRLARAQTEATSLLADLREIAHGIYPVALAEEGLSAAVEALAEQSPVALRVQDRLPGERLDPSIEAAAYLVVREMTRDRRRRWAAVAMARDASRLVLEVSGDSGAPVGLVHLEDRVGAVGGQIRSERTPEGVTRLRAELPCV